MHSKFSLSFYGILSLCLMGCVRCDPEDIGQLTIVEGNIIDANQNPMPNLTVFYGNNFLSSDEAAQDNGAITQTDSTGFYSLSFFNGFQFEEDFALRVISADVLFCAAEDVEVGIKNTIDFQGEAFDTLVQFVFVEGNDLIMPDFANIRASFESNCSGVNPFILSNQYETDLPTSDTLSILGISGNPLNISIQFIENGEVIEEEFFGLDGSGEDVLEIIH